MASIFFWLVRSIYSKCPDLILICFRRSSALWQKGQLFFPNTTTLSDAIWLATNCWAILKFLVAPSNKSQILRLREVKTESKSSVALQKLGYMSSKPPSSFGSQHPVGGVTSSLFLIVKEIRTMIAWSLNYCLVEVCRRFPLRVWNDSVMGC